MSVLDCNAVVSPRACEMDEAVRAWFGDVTGFMWLDIATENVL